MKENKIAMTGAVSACVFIVWGASVALAGDPQVQNIDDTITGEPATRCYYTGGEANGANANGVNVSWGGYTNSYPCSSYDPSAQTSMAGICLYYQNAWYRGQLIYSKGAYTFHPSTACTGGVDVAVITISSETIGPRVWDTDLKLVTNKTNPVTDEDGVQRTGVFYAFHSKIAALADGTTNPCVSTMNSAQYSLDTAGTSGPPPCAATKNFYTSAAAKTGTNSFDPNNNSVYLGVDSASGGSYLPTVCYTSMSGVGVPEGQQNCAQANVNGAGYCEIDYLTAAQKPISGLDPTHQVDTRTVTGIDAGEHVRGWWWVRYEGANKSSPRLCRGGIGTTIQPVTSDTASGVDSTANALTATTMWEPLTYAPVSGTTVGTADQVVSGCYQSVSKTGTPGSLVECQGYDVSNPTDIAAGTCGLLTQRSAYKSWDTNSLGVAGLVSHPKSQAQVVWQYATSKNKLVVCAGGVEVTTDTLPDTAGVSTTPINASGTGTSATILVATTASTTTAPVPTAKSKIPTKSFTATIAYKTTSSDFSADLAAACNPVTNLTDPTQDVPPVSSCTYTIVTADLGTLDPTAKNWANCSTLTVTWSCVPPAENTTVTSATATAITAQQPPYTKTFMIGGGASCAPSALAPNGVTAGNGIVPPTMFTISCP